MSVASAHLRGGRPRGLWKGRLFKAYLYFSLFIGFVTLGALLLKVLIEGWRWVDPVLFLEPPSSDPPKSRAERRRAAREAYKRSMRKSGGQPGHEGHGRPLLPAWGTFRVRTSTPRSPLGWPPLASSPGTTPRTT